MEWYYWILLLLLGWLLVTTISGRPRFWKTVTQYPDQAYLFFLKSDDWRMEDGINDVFQPSLAEGGWTGPFYLQVPMLNGKVVTFYGKLGCYESSQDVFVAMVSVSKRRMRTH